MLRALFLVVTNSVDGLASCCKLPQSARCTRYSTTTDILAARGSHEHSNAFPTKRVRGYAFYGFTPPSRKQQLQCRRVRVQETHEVFTLAPAFVLPYMSGRVAEVADALFLLRFHVPCWAIAQVFGRDAMYWYRLHQGLGRFSLVGTTVKTAVHLPPDLVAGEKHSWLKGERI